MQESEINTLKVFVENPIGKSNTEHLKSEEENKIQSETSIKRNENKREKHMRKEWNEWIKNEKNKKKEKK